MTEGVLAKYVDSTNVLLFRNGSLQECPVKSICPEMVKTYYERSSLSIPSGKVRTLWYDRRAGYYWKGKIIKQIDPEVITTRFLTAKEKVWKWYEVEFAGFPSDVYPEVDIATNLLTKYERREETGILNKGKRKHPCPMERKIKKKETFTETPQKDHIRSALLHDFQAYTPGSFFILEGPNCRTIKHIERTWTNYPKRLDIANFVDATADQIEHYVQSKHSLRFVKVHKMKDADFFVQNQGRKYDGIWLDRCCSNPPDHLDWRNLIERIIRYQHLGSEGILAVTFTKRCALRKIDAERRNVNQDRMLNMVSQVLNSQTTLIRKTDGTPWKYQIVSVHSQSYNNMCTIWWKLKMTPLIF